MPTYNDNNVPYGSQVVTMYSGGSTGVAFVLESIDYKEPSTIIERFDELGNPSGQVIIPQFNNGTATAQFATTLTVPPTIGATFTMVRNGGATVGMVLSEIGEPETQKDAKKAQVSFRKRYGS